MQLLQLLFSQLDWGPQFIPQKAEGFARSAIHLGFTNPLEGGFEIPSGVRGGVAPPHTPPRDEHSVIE